MWGVHVKPTFAEAAELLPCDFLKRVLEMDKTSANEIVLAELSCCRLANIDSSSAFCIW